MGEVRVDRSGIMILRRNTANRLRQTRPCHMVNLHSKTLHITPNRIGRNCLLNISTRSTHNLLYIPLHGRNCREGSNHISRIMILRQNTINRLRQTRLGRIVNLYSETLHFTLNRIGRDCLLKIFTLLT